MKKKALLSIAVLSAALAGSVPVTSQAAGITVVRAGNACGGYNRCNIQTGNDCNIYSGEDLQKILEELCGYGSTCPAPGVPGMGQPGAGGTDAEQPGVQPPSVGGEEDAVLSQAEQVVKLVNEERAKAGLAALTLQADVTKAANVRAKEIKQQFSHTRPNGSSYSSALTEQGISYRMSGENIAYGQNAPETVMEGWMNSSGHRANILNSKYKNIGVGLYQDENGVKYWVQLFT